jgi:hypothetical protein
MRYLGIVALVLFAASAGLACDFEVEPAAVAQYYRAEGWKLPGIAEATEPSATNIYPPFPFGIAPGASAELLKHEYPFIVEFPTQEFEVNGARRKLHTLQAKASIVRWKLNGQVIAYSYSLIPVNAHRKNGKWITTFEAGCIFTATFVDDKGDGVFRILVRSGLTPDLVPAWPKKKA